MELQGKRAAVLVEQMYQEMEVWYPIYRLKEAGCKVTIIGPEAGQTYPSKLGYPVKSDVAYGQLRTTEIDGVIVPGGYAPDRMRRYADANDFVHDMDRAGKLVHKVASRPLEDNVPIEGVPTGPRGFQWRPTAPATTTQTAPDQGSRPAL